MVTLLSSDNGASQVTAKYCCVVAIFAMEGVRNHHSQVAGAYSISWEQGQSSHHEKDRLTKSKRLQECHCMLFLTEDNGFRGEERAITLDTIQEATAGMSGVQP